MNHAASPLAAFHLIGDRTGLDPLDTGAQGLRPALFGNYSDLSRIRYDYPLVLLNRSVDGIWVRSLADIIDDVLHKITGPGVKGETTRRQILALERIIRTLVANGHGGSLAVLWTTASRELIESAGDTGESVISTLEKADAALDADGELADCNRALAAKLIRRAWQQSENLKAQNLLRRIQRLTQKLIDILQVDEMNSPRARSAGRLESSMGAANQSVFDFQAMSRILRSAPAAGALPTSRKKRIQAAIAVLECQRFVAAAVGETASHGETYHFDFDDCHLALAKYQERLPEMAALIRAISIAQLEIENRYDEARHQHFFDFFDENCLGPADLALFPSYLVCPRNTSEKNQVTVLDVLRAGLPFKVIAVTDDLLEDDSITGNRMVFGTRGLQLARMVVGLDRVFVLQAASSALYRLRDSVLQGLKTDGPALFSIYSGCAPDQGPDSDEVSLPDQVHISTYLRAAAATESRAFPCFVYNPAAGSNQASRFHLSGNPEPHSDWPQHRLLYEGAEHNHHEDTVLFTLLDFVAADPRYARRFARVGRENWIDEMMPAGDFLRLDKVQRGGKVPYLLAIDQENIVHRVVFDERLVDAAERCRDTWNCLQELAGIHNSHAMAALAMVRQDGPTQPEKGRPPESVKADAVLVQPAEVESVAAAIDAVSERPAATVAESIAPVGDDPWIETIRCTTCNECTELNDRLFAYDQDMRAHVADPDAGTFRELVEAAENCQVAIIHPGKPRNPDEPGLEELMIRAQAFN